MINPNNTKYYLINFKLCRSITGTLALKAFSPPSAVYSEAIMLWVSPNCLYLETTWGSPKTTESESDTLPALRCSIPCCCNSSHHLSDCNCKRVWTTSSQPCLSRIPNQSTIVRGFGIYRADDQVLNRDEFITLVDLTNMTPWPHERTHLLFSLSQIICLNHSQGETTHEEI